MFTVSSPSRPSLCKMCYPHFTGKETEAQRKEVTSPIVLQVEVSRAGTGI